MNKELLEKMLKMIQERYSQRGSRSFMEIKHEVLNLHNLKGELRRQYSSEISRRLGSLGGKARAEKKRREKVDELVFGKKLLAEMVSEAKQIERQEAIRAGDILPEPDEKELSLIF